MDPRELVEITFRLPLEALGRLAPLLEAAGRGTAEEQTEGGQAASFDMEQFEAVRAEEPVLPERPAAAAGEPEAAGREGQIAEPLLSTAPLREQRNVELGESVREERDVSLERLVQEPGDAARYREAAERESAPEARDLSALWERDARRYDGGFPLL